MIPEKTPLVYTLEQRAVKSYCNRLNAVNEEEKELAGIFICEFNRLSQQESFNKNRNLEVTRSDKQTSNG